MITKGEIDSIIKAYRNYLPFFENSEKLLDIYEGNLKPYVMSALQQCLSPEAYKAAQCRIAPINMLPKIVDKIATIYNDPPTRTVEGGTDQDAELVKWYEEKLKINSKMSDCLDLYSATKSAWLQPYFNEATRQPGVRPLPNDRFFVLSNDQHDPLRPTHLVTFSCKIDEMGSRKIVFEAYTETDFCIFDEYGAIDYGRMTAIGNPEGVNVYGVLPGAYANSSRLLLMPSCDSDMYSMTVLIPVLLSDLNFAVMYQCFSIMYGIDVDDENIKMSPNAFWKFKSDPSVDKTPQVGVIKPQVDIDQVKGLIVSEISLWLSSKGIRPGSLGDVSIESAASAISKVVDESDTVDYRKSLAEYFSQVEADFWDVLLNKMHPVWVAQGVIENRTIFTPSAKVVTTFAPQTPLIDRAKLVADAKAELEAGLTSRERAIKALNPQMAQDDIDALIAEITGANEVESASETTESQN